TLLHLAFFITDTATTAISTLSLHDALPIWIEDDVLGRKADALREELVGAPADLDAAPEAVGLPLLVEGHHHHRGAVLAAKACLRSEEHTSELQSRFDLVCRLLLEKKKQN